MIKFLASAHASDFNGLGDDIRNDLRSLCLIRVASCLFVMCERIDDALSSLPPSSHAHAIKTLSANITHSELAAALKSAETAKKQPGSNSMLRTLFQCGRGQQITSRSSQWNGVLAQFTVLDEQTVTLVKKKLSDVKSKCDAKLENVVGDASGLYNFLTQLSLPVPQICAFLEDLFSFSKAFHQDVSKASHQDTKKKMSTSTPLPLRIIARVALVFRNTRVATQAVLAQSVCRNVSSYCVLRLRFCQFVGIAFLCWGVCFVSVQPSYSFSLCCFRQKLNRGAPAALRGVFS